MVAQLQATTIVQELKGDAARPNPFLWPMKEVIDQLIANFTILTVRYFVLCGFFFIMFYVLLRRPLKKYRLQEDSPAGSDFRREILYSISSALVIGAVFTMTITVLLPYTLIYDNIGTYGTGYYVLSYLLMLVIHDTYFYWTHRLIHSKRLFRVIHRVHHRSTNPSPWTSYSFHPLEALIQALVFPIIAMTIPVQKSALIIYFFFQFVQNIYGHLGYEILPAFVRNSRLGKHINTSVIHNRHHRRTKGNYGLYFTTWDRLMGTYSTDPA